MKDHRKTSAAPLSSARQAWLMLVVIAPMAACYPAIKVGLGFAPPLQLAGARTLVGGLILLLVLLIRKKPLWPEARLARWILPLGVLATTLTFGAMFASPAYTGAGIASVLGNTQPLIIIVLAALFLGEKIRLSNALALGLGLAGVTLLALPAFSEQTGHPLLGAMLAPGSSGSAAVASVTVKKLCPGNDLMSLTAWQLIAGSVALLGLSAVFEPSEAIIWTGGFCRHFALPRIGWHRVEHLALVLAATAHGSRSPLAVFVPSPSIRTNHRDGRLRRTLEPAASEWRGVDLSGRRAVHV